MADTRLDELLALLQTHRAVLLTAAHDVPAHLRATSPPSGGWSVYQVLDHVARVDGMIVRLLTSLVPRAPLYTSTSTGDVAAAVARLRPVIARRTRVTAVAGSEPAADPDAVDVASALTHVREHLLHAVADTVGRDLTTLTYPHPIIGPLNLLEWIVFAGMHDGRHAAQIRELAGTLTNDLAS